MSEKTIQAGALLTGHMLWLEDTGAWHQVTVLPDEVMLPTTQGRVLAINLHLTPNHPVRWISYPIPVTQLVRIQEPK